MTPRPLASPLPPPSGRSGGFTLSEVILALVVLACGAMALAGTGAAAVRAVALAEAQERATVAARARVERLASRGCGGLTTGGAVDSSGVFREHWIVTPIRNGVRLVTDTVEHSAPGIGRPIVVQRLVIC